MSGARSPADRVSRHLVVRSFAVALGASAWALGHHAAYRVVGLDPSQTGHGYLPFVGAASALLAALSLAAFVALLARRRSGHEPLEVDARYSRRLPAWVLVPGFAFVVVELAERSFARVPPLLLLLVGVGLQLVLAATAHLASRSVLVDLTVAVRRRDEPSRTASPNRHRQREGLVLSAAPLAGAAACRAPPSV